jgi:hypothetical protein
MQTMDNKANEITQDYYNELVSFLKATKDGSEKAEAKDPVAQTLITKTDTYYESAIRTLTDLSQQRFGKPSAGDKFKDGVAHATGAVSGFFSGLGPHSDSKQLRDAYTGLTTSSCGLQMLYATEVAGNGKSPHSDQLLSLLRQHHELVIEYGHVIPQIVVTELASEEGLGFSTAHTNEIVENLQSTWH